MADPDHLTFRAWQRSQVVDGAVRQGPRLAGQLVLTLTDADTGQSATETATYALMSAADVSGLRSSAIRHRAPAPFARDAETTKLVHVDLVEPDLPWRYTPASNSPTLKPWLVLLVGTTDELKVEGGLVTFAAPALLAAHDLDESHLWAHTQTHGDTTVGRIVSPRGLARPGAAAGLLPQSEYLAVLVPAFNDAGEPMWTSAGEPAFGTRGVLPAFDFWRFWTATAGDFMTLAEALHLPPARDVGTAILHYRRDVPDAGIHLDAELQVRGAITSLAAPTPPDPAVLAEVRSDLDALNDEQPNTIGLPQYGRPWVPEPDDVAAGWPFELTDDPRFRGTTGLGVWMGVEGQEALMDAAVAQAGALREAGQRIGQLALGLLASGRLWDRRMPTDQLERLRLLGPLMSRMAAADGGLVLDRVTSGTSPLVPALFSSAAQRVLRDRSGPTRHLAADPGSVAALSVPAVFNAANTAERDLDRAPDGLPHVDALARGLGMPIFEELLKLDDKWLDEAMLKLDGLVQGWVRRWVVERDKGIRTGNVAGLPALLAKMADALFDELVQTMQELLAGRHLPCEGQGIAEQVGIAVGESLQTFCQSVLDDSELANSNRLGGAAGELHDEIRRAIRQCMARNGCNALMGQDHGQDGGPTCNDLLDLSPSRPPTEQRPIDLGVLSDALVAAMDPRQESAPAHVRVCAQLNGVDCSRLIPPEFPIGLDFPTWNLLKTYDQEWLLPGVGALEKDSVTALQTNPAFIDAFMVGINTQFLAEMRWRDLAVDRTCTPLRMFWGQVDYATHQREADIVPLAEWAKTVSDPTGALSHQSIPPADPGENPSGSRLVLTFRSDLFRRYPSTLVYLVRARPGDVLDDLLKSPPQLDVPDGQDPAAWRLTQRYYGPIFVGVLTPEITFFTFDVTPDELDEYWLVLDEPPHELRFRNVAPVAEVDTDAGTFAASMLDQPVRVGIDGHALEEQGRNA